MATSKPGPIREYVETGGEPEFLINDLTIEDAGGGNIRIFCYAKRHGEYRLQFSVVAGAIELSEMARKVMHAAADAHNLQMWDTDGTQGH